MNLLATFKSRGFVLEVIESVFLESLLDPFRLFGELDPSHELVVLLLDKIPRSFCLPGHSFVKIVVFVVIPLLSLDFWRASFPESIQEHIIIDFI